MGMRREREAIELVMASVKADKWALDRWGSVGYAFTLSVIGQRS
jgi:hypothetical protein